RKDGLTRGILADQIGLGKTVTTLVLANNKAPVHSRLRQIRIPQWHRATTLMVRNAWLEILR
ncbi:hypothetical protein BDZ85DRAFT_260051, partial [Elsinoe ampelina]